MLSYDLIRCHANMHAFPVGIQQIASYVGPAQFDLIYNTINITASLLTTILFFVMLHYAPSF